MSDQKTTCVRCHAILFEEDDVVTCPICGAPHHRACYQALGHCALEELHGTDRQYDKLKEAEETSAAAEEHTGENAEGLITCAMCREKYDFSLPSCPKCGAPNVAKAGGSFATFDFLGGVPGDFDIGEGVTAEEAKRFIMVNTQRYIPKFAFMGNTKISWNWAAFLFPCGWMLSRKMYKNGIIAGVLGVIATLFSLPLVNAAYNFGLSEAKTYPEMVQVLADNLSKIGLAVIIFAMAGIVLNLAIRIVSAILGDYFYKEYTIGSIKSIRAESMDADYDYRKLGGVNIFLFLIGVMAVQYLPAIIMTFL